MVPAPGLPGAVRFPPEVKASCEYTGREGSGCSACTVLPAIITGVFVFRAGKAVFTSAVCRLTAMTGAGWLPIGLRGGTGLGIGR